AGSRRRAVRRPDRQRAQRAAAHGAGVEQPGDRPGAVHQPQDRAELRELDLPQAAGREPGGGDRRRSRGGTPRPRSDRTALSGAGRSASARTNDASAGGRWGIARRGSPPDADTRGGTSGRAIRAVGAGVVALGLLTAACGGSDDSDESTAATSDQGVKSG